MPKVEQKRNTEKIGKIIIYINNSELFKINISKQEVDKTAMKVLHLFPFRFSFNLSLLL